MQGLYCVGDSTFPGQGVNAVVFSGFGCAHRVLCDQGKQAVIPCVGSGIQRSTRSSKGQVRDCLMTAPLEAMLR